MRAKAMAAGTVRDSTRNESLSFPNFYDWQLHQPIIDPYMAALQKIVNYYG